MFALSQALEGRVAALENAAQQQPVRQETSAGEPQDQLAARVQELEARVAELVSVWRVCSNI